MKNTLDAFILSNMRSSKNCLDSDLLILFTRLQYLLSSAELLTLERLRPGLIWELGV